MNIAQYCTRAILRSITDSQIKKGKCQSRKQQRRIRAHWVSAFASVHS